MAGEEHILAREKVVLEAVGFDEVERQIDALRDRMSRLSERVREDTARTEKDIGRGFGLAGVAERAEREAGRVQGVFARIADRFRETFGGRQWPGAGGGSFTSDRAFAFTGAASGGRRPFDNFPRRDVQVGPRFDRYDERRPEPREVMAVQDDPLTRAAVRLEAAAAAIERATMGMASGQRRADLGPGQVPSARRGEAIPFGIPERLPVGRRIADPVWAGNNRAFLGGGVTTGGRGRMPDLPPASAFPGRQVDDLGSRIERLGRRMHAAAGAAEKAARAEERRERIDRFASGAATAGAAAGTAMLYRGFSGTVEGNRLSTELDLLAKEFAGAFKPVIDDLTKGTEKVRKYLETMTPEGQDRLAAAGIGLAGAAATQKAGFGRNVVESGLIFALAVKVADMGDLMLEYRAMGQDKDRLAKGGLTAAEYAKSGVGTDEKFNKIADKEERLKAMRIDLNETVQKRAELAKQMDPERNPKSLFRSFRSELASVFGHKIAPELGPNQRDVVEATREARVREAALKERIAAEKEGRAVRVKEGDLKPNEDRRQVTYAQAGYGAAGSTAEELQVAFLKLSATEETKDPIVERLDKLIEAIKEARGEPKKGGPQLQPKAG